MIYCKDALKLLKIETLCGGDCPLFKSCPRLIMEDASDKVIERAMKTLIKLFRERTKAVER